LTGVAVRRACARHRRGAVARSRGPALHRRGGHGRVGTSLPLAATSGSDA